MAEVFKFGQESKRPVGNMLHHILCHFVPVGRGGFVQLRRDN